MNIIFFMQDTGAVFGAERATIDLACGLRDAGDCVQFFLIEESRLPSHQRPLQNALETEGLAFQTFKVSSRISRTLAADVRRAFTDASGDVLHVVGYKANVHARMAGVHPVIATVHGWLFRRDLKERLYDAIDRWCLRGCDQVICLSSYYEKLLLDKGVKREKLSLIPSGLRVIPSDHEISKPSGDRPFTFGMMGRFSEEKNHRMFLDAAKEVRVRCPDVRFRLAGQGPLESMIRRDAESMGLSSAIDFCGYVSVHAFMTMINAYIICSKIENLPYSIMEAMAWARPVIATRVGGMPDLVIHGETGMLVESGNAAGLAEAMVTLAGNASMQERMGMSGRKKIQSAFTLSNSVMAHQTVYGNARKQSHA